MCIYMNNKMRPRIRLGVIWSLEELQKLVSDENSCVYMKRSRKHVALHPIHLNNLSKAFQDILDSSINVYDSQFKGLLLAYKNPKLISQLGTILYDSHFIHVDIEADFYIFRAEVQRVLSGVINKKADNYVGVLVHKVFNVSIPKREEEENWEGHHLEVGDDVTFTIEHVDLKGKLPFIRGKLLSRGTSTSTSHIFFNSDEELDNDDTANSLETVNESNKTNKLKRPGFLATTNSDSSDEETQTVNEIVNDDKYSKALKSSSQDEEEVYEKQPSFESTITTRDEDEYDPIISNGTGTSKKSSKKYKKKSSKDKEHHMKDENNTLHHDSTFNESESTSITENEIPTKKSKKRKYENTEESSFSEPLPKIRKYKKKHRMSEVDEHHISDEKEKVLSKDNEIETSKMLVKEKATRKSKKKHKEKIKVEYNEKQADFNGMESNSASLSSDIDHSRDSTQEERPSKFLKKSSKDKDKLKQKIKEEQRNSSTSSGHKKEYNQTLETEYETNRNTELSQREDNQTDISSHNYSNNDTDISQNFDEFEMPIKSAKKQKKKKRSSTGDDFLAVKIKEEPVSDVESGSSKKSKRKRKNRENDSFNNLDTETLETDSSQHKKQKNKEKEPVREVSVGKIKVKQEFVIKEETIKKKKHKEGNQSTLNIKRESRSSDVEGTAVKKKIKTLFTE